MVETPIAPLWRRALLSAAPAMLAGAIVLAAFAATPFTIDDPIFLREAQHILKDPLHPQAFNIVWTFDVMARASQLLPGGVAAAYPLAPVVLAPNKEVAGHLEQIVFLCVFLWATAMLALRLGLDEPQARWASLLTVAAPALLGMASTVMPDLAAATYVALGFERLLAWREDPRWGRAITAAVWLALATLTRTHCVLMVVPAVVFLLDGLRLEQVGNSFRSHAARWLPIVLIPLLCAAALWITADPNPSAHGLASQLAPTWAWRVKNLLGFGAHWVLTTPFAVLWLLLRWQRIPLGLFGVFVIGGLAVSLQLQWVGVVAALGGFFLADAAWVALRERNRDGLALFLWLLPGLAPVIYIHLPSKYIVPSLPAAAILVAGLLPHAIPAIRRYAVPAVLAASLVSGVMVLIGIRDLAENQVEAAQRMIAPRVQAGQPVWFLGQWGFHWYAEEAGAKPATLVDPLPSAGDIIVVAFADWMPERASVIRHSMIDEWDQVEPGIRVMDSRGGSGFFSNVGGYLPWVWGTNETNRFEVWKVE